MKTGELEEELEQNVVDIRPHLELVTGGKGPPGSNWLSTLPLGTTFLCKDNRDKDNFNLPYFILLSKTKSSYVLLNNLNEPSVMITVDPVLFSRRFDLVEVLSRDNEE